MSKSEEIAAMAVVLADPENAEKTAEEVATLARVALDQVRTPALARAHNLIVVGRFSFDGVRTFDAAVGPLSTRAQVAAREVGARFAWDYKSRTGEGRFKLLPLLRDPKAAWDYVRKLGVEEESTGREDPHMPLEKAVQHAVSDAMAWTPDPEILRSMGPACCCAATRTPTACAVHGSG